MRIAIPANGETLDSGVCPSFGRAPFFLIHDSNAKENTFIKNLAADSQGGAGIRAAQAVADSGANAVLTPRCGENAAKVLKAAGIKICLTEGLSLTENIGAFLRNELKELTEAHPGLHGQQPQ